MYTALVLVFQCVTLYIDILTWSKLCYFFEHCATFGLFLIQLGKSVVAKVKIPKGTILTADMLTVKVAEPIGVKAEDIFELVGKTVMEDLEEDESIAPEVVDSYGKKAKC